MRVYVRSCIRASRGAELGAQWRVAGVGSCCHNVCETKDPFKQQNSSAMLAVRCALGCKHQWNRFLLFQLLHVCRRYELLKSDAAQHSNVVNMVRLHTFHVFALLLC